MTDVKPYLSAADIAARVRALGDRISSDYAGGSIVVVPVLKGSFVFAADLVRAITVPVEIDFLAVRSYEGTESSGVVRLTHDLDRSIEGRDVLLVEDIVDTGLTIDYLLGNLATRRPRSLRVAALLHKPARTKVVVPIDYLGFEIDDVFVVGYGLDDDRGGRRHLPYIGALEPAALDPGARVR
ncbi:MAG: hypoxanthine phosphoribosyltransferase [Myxococcales bacterium]|nr:hypoxanthine phosphoribosyltransferase [Myxococcales bacterium]